MNDRVARTSGVGLFRLVVALVSIWIAPAQTQMNVAIAVSWMMTFSNLAAAQDFDNGGVKTPWKIKKAKREAQDKASEVAKVGLVYKKKNFWSGYFNAYIMEGVFNGDWNPQGQNFSMYLVRHLDEYGTRCRKTVQAQWVTQVTTVKNFKQRGFGVPLLDSELKSEIHLEQRFVEIFNKHAAAAEAGIMGTHVKEYFDLQKRTGRPGIVSLAESESLSMILKPFADMRAFHDTCPCGSATMKQFHENFYRLAAGQPSLQEAGVAIENAAAESDVIE